MIIPMLKKKTKADHPFLQDKLFREFIAGWQYHETWGNLAPSPPIIQLVDANVSY